jgi:hypothetical protein
MLKKEKVKETRFFKKSDFSQRSISHHARWGLQPRSQRFHNIDKRYRAGCKPACASVAKMTTKVQNSPFPKKELE